MHITLYHNALIPPEKYGGTERVIAWLSKGLVTLGHHVTLIAKAGSSIPGVETIPIRSKIDEKKWVEWVPQKTDILHLWGTPQIAPKKPFVVTIEGNGQPGEKFHSNTVFISRKHAENHGAVAFVYNGLDPDEFPFDKNTPRQNYAVFLAKASWKVKNLAGAIEVARYAGLELVVLGSRDWPLNLNHLLRPYLGGKFPFKRSGIEYVGMANDQLKKDFLSRAKALLFPVRWHEPFGIATIEALACGCPVFGTPYGALPEIVPPEVGTLRTSVAELGEALKSQLFPPQACRDRLNAGFTHLQMAKAYLAHYETILSGQSLNPPSQKLTFQSQVSAETLLPWG